MMQRPAIIRTPFITPEEVAEVYGLPRSHVTKLQKLLMESAKNRAAKNAKKKSTGTKNSTSRARGKKRSAKKTK